MPLNNKRITIPPRLDTPSFRKIVDIVIRAAAPDRLILFGSRARGDERVDSDIDLVIVKSGIAHERELTGSVYRALFDEGADESVDLIALRPEKLESTGRKGGMISIFNKEGITLYE